MEPVDHGPNRSTKSESKSKKGFCILHSTFRLSRFMGRRVASESKSIWQQGTAVSWRLREH